jgi:hypothetical protein
MRWGVLRKRQRPDRFLAVVQRFVPPSERAKVAAVFSLGRAMRQYVRGTEEPCRDVGIFLDMVEQCQVEWRLVAEMLREPGGRAAGVEPGEERGAREP